MPHVNRPDQQANRPDSAPPETRALPGARPNFGERYRVEREIGRGGMATVYLCFDTHVEHLVAVKVLHPDLAAAVGAERFHREVRITSALTHPHILPAFDSGEIEGSLFYVMPYVDGESLRARIARERQLPVQDAVNITCEIAGALQYAHSQHIIHRDIKPENVLLESGRAVLADFGIARAITSAADVEQLTQTGVSLGTPTYMSPEQALGDKHIDGRSDQYSLACVLYEMLTGYPPFMANTLQALVAKHLGEPVPMITTVRPAVPDELEDVIMRALEKVPADRFASMQEFAEALVTVAGTTGTWARRTGRITQSRLAAVRPSRSSMRLLSPGRLRRRRAAIAAACVLLMAGGVFAWRFTRTGGDGSVALQGGADALDKRRVAVLYFEDLSRDRSLAPAADGFTEGLIAELTRVRALKVVSAAGVAPYRQGDVPRDSIARALQAGSLIVGSIEPAGRRVRVTARLVDGRSGVDAERASVELPADQLLVARDSLVQQVAALLRRWVGDEVRLEASRIGTSSMDAWTAVQRAQRMRKDADALFRTRDPRAGRALLARADSVLQLAERADARWLEPVRARGWIALRQSQLDRGAMALPWVEAGLAHAGRALSLAPADPEALALRGSLQYRQWQLRVTTDKPAQDALLQRARRDLETAVQADPTLAGANVTLSHLYYDVDDVPGALLAARRAYEEDVYLEEADRTLSRLFWGSIDLEQMGEARRWCAEGARRFPRDPRFVQCQLWLMVTPAVPADPVAAWGLVALLDSVTPPAQHAFLTAQGRILAAGALARAGQVDSARRVLARNRDGITSQVDPEQNLLAHEAYVRTLTGEPDAAIDLLKRYVVANPTHGFAEQAGTVWWWRELRTHARWHEVAQPRR